MTTLSILSIIIIATIALAGIVCFIEYPRSAVDQTRNELFRLRSDLFEIAHNGKVSFDHRGYGTARDMLNGMIRYAHDVSATHLLFANLFANREARLIRQAVGKAITNDLNSLPKAAKADVDKILESASLALVRLIVFRSVTLSCVFATYAAAHGTIKIVKAMSEKLKIIFHFSREALAPRKAHVNNVEESMHEVMDHSPMRKVPRLVAREATRYTKKFDMQIFPAIPDAA